MVCCFQYSELSPTRRLMVRVFSDVICISLVSACLLAIKYGAQPFHRGFFCDDESIKHPLLPDTIPMSWAASVGILVPLIVIVVLEFSLRDNNNDCIISIKKHNSRKISWFGAIYNAAAVFLFGLAVTELLTQVGKYSIGRLRPHFLTVCNPDLSLVNCSFGYITTDVCTNTDATRMKDARLSFPSGHSSFSMYCVLFLILYLQSRISCQALLLVKPVIQLILFSMGFYTCLSRISDYKHHWSDVLAGAILGMTVCVSVILSLADFGQHLFSKEPPVCRMQNGLQSGNQTDKTRYCTADEPERQRLWPRVERN